MKIVKVIEQIEPEIATAEFWNGRIQMALLAPNGLHKIRELILNLAVRGRLVCQNPKEESASISLKKAGIVLSSEAVFVPSGWSLAKVGDVLSLEYGKSLPDRARSGTGEVEVFGSNGVVGTHHTGCVNEPCIVVGRKGSSGALNFSHGRSCWVTDVAYFVLIPKYFDPQYLFYSLSTLGLSKLGKGIKPGLNRNEAYELNINIPPFAEQRRIVTRINELLVLCDKLEREIIKYNNMHEQLSNALVEKALEV